jgi:hypothetical protein
MGYPRPAEMPTPDKLGPKFEAAIKSLVLQYRNHFSSSKIGNVIYG